MDIVVIYGGKSTEHEVSVRSAKTIINGLDRDKYSVYAVFIDKNGIFNPIGKITEPIIANSELTKKINNYKLDSIKNFCDFVQNLENPLIFPALHGQSGEDGEIQGFLQTLGLPYAGVGLTSSAICMDKGFADLVMKGANIPHAKFYILTKNEYENTDWSIIFNKILKELGKKVFVKPANCGSSVGVTRANRNNLRTAIETALKYDNRVVIEESIDGVELEISIIGNHNNAKASLLGNYTFVTDIFNYHAKYVDTCTIENVPYPLSEEKTKEVQAIALKTYRELGCEGLSRIDIFMDKNENFFVNEINTLPGMTETSLAPKLWTQLTDMTFSKYLDIIIESAIESNKDRKRIQTSYDKI